MSGRARVVVGYERRIALARELPGGPVPVIREVAVPEWVATDPDRDDAAVWWLSDAMRTELGIDALVVSVANTGPGRFTIEWED